ncbi:hypothetical protein COB57_01495 [Candidatus Peregrinibacteria bacterium]|nr:MAG: hypothetical protein COB57_01495 [Candidatus Peregrinibacteria bacterium]
MTNINNLGNILNKENKENETPDFSNVTYHIMEQVDQVVSLEKFRDSVFVNREEERRYILDHLSFVPHEILFIYGPKSSGKTTMMDFIYENEMDDIYETRKINLRGLLLSNYESFINIFFKDVLIKIKSDEVEEKRAYKIPFFQLDIKIKKKLEQKELDPFEIMEYELMKIKQSGKKPVIIIDEIQKLSDIYFEKERKLINEFFNFFIRITKELHLAHVIILSSDSYFLHSLWDEANLSATSEAYKINHLGYAEVVTWLHSKKFNDSEIEYIWNNIGGASHQITRIIHAKESGRSIEKKVNFIIDSFLGDIRKTYYQKIIDHDKASFLSVLKEMSENGSAQYCGQISIEILEIMMHQDLWFYDLNMNFIEPNSPVIIFSIKKFLEELSLLSKDPLI